MLLEKTNKLIVDFTGINVSLRGENPVNLKLLDDFQYIQEITETEVITLKDITTIKEALND
jgi:hypothetical protein